MKKFLSIILAVVLVASLLPATFMTAAAAEQTELNYVFSHAAHTSSAGNNGVKNTNLASVGFDEMNTAVSSGAWGNLNGRNTYATHVYGIISSLSVHSTQDYLNIAINNADTNDDNGFYNWDSRGPNKPDASPIGIIAIDVPVAGKYIPSVTGVANGGGQKFEFFLIKEDDDNKTLTPVEIHDSLNIADRIGVYDSSVGGTETFLEHYLAKGTYYLVFTPNGKGEGSAEAHSQVVLLLKSFKLTPVGTYDASLGASNYNFNLEAFNVGNKIVDGDVTTWYFADSKDNINAYAALTGGHQIEQMASNLYYNDWTDQSDEAKARDKYIPWVTTANSGATYSYNMVTARDRQRYYFHPLHAEASRYVQGTYDYLNLANTAPWQFAGKSTHINESNSYMRNGKGLHLQINAGQNSAVTARGGENQYVAFKIKVPQAAKYDVEVGVVDTSVAASGKNSDFAVYMLPATGELPTTYAGRKDYYIFDGDFRTTSAASPKKGTYNATTAGEHYIIIEIIKDTDTPANTGAWEGYLDSIKLTPTGPAEITKSDELLAKEAAMVLDEGNPDAEDVSGGEATINVLARAIDEDDDTIDDVITTVANVATGAAYTTEEAPEIQGYKFLYWGVGIGTNMRVVSTEETATIKAAKGANYVYAFYSKDNAEDVTVEFYNANRELLKRTSYQAGEEIGIPTLPELTGVGKAIGWSMDGGKTLVDADDVIEAEGSVMAFFAVYDEEAIAKDVEITALGSTGITGAGTYAFGDVVTLTAPARENGNGYNMFLYWKKGDDGEIVSFDRVYKFNAAVSCNVTAVYAKYGPTSVNALRKIFVSTVGEAVVAEFIGCENALERGFIFGELRQPMMTDAKSFTMINDTTSEAKAYAIFTDGVIYSK